jgi:hypothetical protein
MLRARTRPVKHRRIEPRIHPSPYSALPSALSPQTPRAAPGRRSRSTASIPACTAAADSEHPRARLTVRHCQPPLRLLPLRNHQLQQLLLSSVPSPTLSMRLLASLPRRQRRASRRKLRLKTGDQALHAHNWETGGHFAPEPYGDGRPHPAALFTGPHPPPRPKYLGPHLWRSHEVTRLHPSLKKVDPRTHAHHAEDGSSTPLGGALRVLRSVGTASCPHAPSCGPVDAGMAHACGTAGQSHQWIAKCVAERRRLQDRARAHTHTCIRARTRTHACTHAYAHTRTHTRKHARTHPRTHPCTHTHLQHTRLRGTSILFVCISVGSDRSGVRVTASAVCTLSLSLSLSLTHTHTHTHTQLPRSAWHRGLMPRRSVRRCCHRDQGQDCTKWAAGHEPRLRHRPR